MYLLGEGLQAVFNILLTHGFRYFIIKFKWLNFNMAKLIPLALVSVFVLSLMSSVFLALIILIRNDSVSIETLMQPIVIQTTESIFLFLFWSLTYFIYLYFERYNTSLKYEATIRETELRNLKSQLNPHFIFNALNSIRALVDENPKKSKEAITQLSHILRNSLNSDRQKLVPFAEELRTVKDYLGLESMRYEERLRTKYHIVKGSEVFQVPPLMLQTLVENGVKHGISKLTKGGEIIIRTKLEADRLVVQVRNSGQLGDEKSIGSGFGLSNTKKRLEMIYGDRFEFLIKNEDEKTVLTEIKLPK
ncbi:MAG: histidine kinase [Cytophagales bacterium]|nr:histidine kinase [Cytophagales bacterium]